MNMHACGMPIIYNKRRELRLTLSPSPDNDGYNGREDEDYNDREAQE